ncbi:MAG TPA: hypothetical protein VK946_07255 [Methylotenera sp.]|nr:hypothetical protein [Methylotenera sp.]
MMRQVLSSYYANPLALCVYIGLVVAGIFLEHRNHQHHELLVALSLSALVAMLVWAFNFKRLLSISEIPTSTIAAAAQGYVELSGKSKSILPMRSPIRGVDCVWFRMWVYVRDSNHMWRLAQYNASEQLFEMQDLTGRCRIDPKGAEILAASRYVRVQNDHKYIEDVLFSDKPIYVLGDLDTGSQINTEAEIYQDVGKLVTQWKRSKLKFLQQFDLNRDGAVDMQEWELAREKAYAEVKLKHEIRAKNEVHLISQPRNNRLFLISGISPHMLRQSYKNWAIVHFMLFSAAAIACISLIVSRLAT